MPRCGSIVLLNLSAILTVQGDIWLVAQLAGPVQANEKECRMSSQGSIEALVDAQSVAASVTGLGIVYLNITTSSLPPWRPHMSTFSSNSDPLRFF